MVSEWDEFLVEGVVMINESLPSDETRWSRGHAVGLGTTSGPVSAPRLGDPMNVRQTNLPVACWWTRLKPGRTGQ